MTTETSLEQKVLGLAFTSPRDFQDLIAASVRPEHFHNPVNRAVWEIALSLEASGQHVDPETVFAARTSVDVLAGKRVTRDYLFACYQAAPIGHVATTYAGLLRGEHDRMETGSALVRAQQSLDGGVDPQTVRLEALTALQAVTDTQSDLVTTSDSLTETFEALDQIARYAPTPWRGLNRAIRGWRPGGLYVVGARPGVGKSLVLQATALLLADRGPVVYESLEMSHAEIMVRMLAQSTGVPQYKLTGLRDDGTSALSPVDREALSGARQQIQRLPILFGQGTRTIMDVREHSRNARARGPLAGIVVDYLQLMSGVRRTSDRVQEVSQITRELKLLAMEFDCPVIVASQLNRAGDGSPTLTSLRESGSIEQDADVVILLEKPSWEPGPSGDLELDAIIAKNRQGPTSFVPLLTNGAVARVTDDLSGRTSIQDMRADTQPTQSNRRNPF